MPKRPSIGKLASAVVVATAISANVVHAQSRPGYHVVRAWSLGVDVGQLSLGQDGNFYANSPNYEDQLLGAILKITPTGDVTVLHLFTGGSDGQDPDGALVQGPDGELYGTTRYGGDPDSFGGTIFRISTSGQFKLLHSFSGGAGGAGSTSALVLGADGSIYGTTQYGGVGRGTIFKLDRQGRFTVLRDFSQDALAQPAGMTLAPDGTLVGVARASSPTEDCGANGCGGLFRLATNGTRYREVVFTRDKGVDPEAPPVVGADDDVFGTAASGGDSAACDFNGCGTIWRYSMERGGVQVIHRFKGTDGAVPIGGVILASDGNLYGVAVQGGDEAGCRTTGCGVAYRMSTVGYSIIHRFKPAGGTAPVYAPLEVSAVSLYGSTVFDGMFGYGTLYRITEDGTSSRP